MRNGEKRRVLKFLNDIQSVLAERMTGSWEQGNWELFWESLNAFRAVTEVVRSPENQKS